MLHRKIRDHWIWKSDHRFKWWIDVLLSVNHCDNKVLIKGTLIECKRGQSVMSLDTWAKRWNVTKKTVKDFFELLQKDSMLVYEGMQNTTRITVCNYDSYQGMVNDTKTQSKRQVNATETLTAPKQELKEGNNDININKECLLKERETEFKESVKQYSNQYPVNMLKSFCDYWTEPNKSKTKMRFELEKTFEISRRLATWASRDKTFIKTEHAQSEPAYYKPLPKL